MSRSVSDLLKLDYIFWLVVDGKKDTENETYETFSPNFICFIFFENGSGEAVWKMDITGKKTICCSIQGPSNIFQNIRMTFPINLQTNLFS